MVKTACAFLCLSLIACNHTRSKQPAITNTPALKETTANPANGVPGTMPLPFGTRPKNIKDVATYNKTFNYTSDSIIIKKLPYIKAAHYVVIDTDYNVGLCYSIPVDANIHLSAYKYRLPRYKGFEVYYMAGSPGTAELKEEFGTSCEANYGNLIVYNPKLQTANVLTVYYSFYIDSVQSQYFYIDKDYTIYMAGESVSEGEDGVADAPTPGNVYRAVITTDGSFSVKKISEP